MTLKVFACPLWHPLFTRHTIKSRFVPISELVARYLGSNESVIMGDALWASGFASVHEESEDDSDEEKLKMKKNQMNHDQNQIDHWKEKEKDMSDHGENSIASDEEIDFESHPEIISFFKQVQVIIEEFGDVFPKLNWSAPKVFDSYDVCDPFRMPCGLQPPIH